MISKPSARSRPVRAQAPAGALAVPDVRTLLPVWAPATRMLSTPASYDALTASAVTCAGSPNRQPEAPPERAVAHLAQAAPPLLLGPLVAALTADDQTHVLDLPPTQFPAASKSSGG